MSPNLLMMIKNCFERFGDQLKKVQWISIGVEKFTPVRSRADLPVKTVAELTDMDPLETEVPLFLFLSTILQRTDISASKA